MNLKPKDRLLEIGPGQGALTEYLIGQTSQLTAVEIDRDLIPFLQARFPSLTLINADVLSLDLGDVVDHDSTRVVGNLPYNISSPLLIQLAALVREHPGKMQDGHFMLQREMAQRLAASPGSKAWGRLSVMMQLSFDVEHLFDIPPESFTPPPKVWSSVLRLLPKAAPLLKTKDEVANLDTLLRLAFSGRRKRLANALKTLPIDWESTRLDPNVRADDVSLEAFVALAIHLRSPV